MKKRRFKRGELYWDEVMEIFGVVTETPMEYEKRTVLFWCDEEYDTHWYATYELERITTKSQLTECMLRAKTITKEFVQWMNDNKNVIVGRLW